MNDLRALLYDHWCPKCGTDIGPKHLDHTTLCPEGITAPLATRLPECVPPGLGWDRGSKVFTLYRDASTDGTALRIELAELLFIGKGVLMIAECGWVLDYSVDGWSVFGWGVDEDKSQSGGHHKTAIAALAAALHRYTDEKESDVE